MKRLAHYQVPCMHKKQKSIGLSKIKETFGSQKVHNTTQIWKSKVKEIYKDMLKISASYETKGQVNKKNCELKNILETLV